MKPTRHMTGPRHQPLFDFDRIAASARDLNALALDTEPEFLKIGRVLNTLSTICFGMTDNAIKLSRLAKFATDDEKSKSESFIAENAKIFEAITGHVKTTITSLGDGEHLLVNLLTQMRKLREPIRKLQSTGKTFRVLGVGIKVESARAREEMLGFTLLAEEVSEIAKLVQDNCGYCIEKANLVENGISTSMQVLNSRKSSYDEGGEQAVSNILQSLEKIGLQSDQLAAGIQERSALMVQGISDVVMAMQFHDITRQQLENVSTSLMKITRKAQSVQDQERAEVSEEVVLEIYSILSIQAAHLNSIYEQVISARRKIETGLEKTMEQASIQAKDAGAMLEMEDRSGNKSIVADLEKEIDKVVVSLNKSLQVVKQAAEVSRDLYDNVAEIGTFVNKIEEIAFDVKILAINAMVEALKTDATGNALTVLAKELSTLSQETRDGATDSIKILQSIMERTERQLEYVTNLEQSGEAVDEMINRAKKFTGKILLSLQEVSRIGHTMDSSSRDLSSRITKLVPGIKFPQVMGDRIDRNWQTISRAIDQIENDYPWLHERSSEVKQMVEKQANQYVMERERTIHAQVAGQAGGTTASGNVDLFEDDGFELFEERTAAQQGRQMAFVGKEEDFGDNVELF